MISGYISLSTGLGNGLLVSKNRVEKLQLKIGLVEVRGSRVPATKKIPIVPFPN